MRSNDSLILLRKGGLVDPLNSGLSYKLTCKNKKKVHKVDKLYGKNNKTYKKYIQSITGNYRLNLVGGFR